MPRLPAVLIPVTVLGSQSKLQPIGPARYQRALAKFRSTPFERKPIKVRVEDARVLGSGKSRVRHHDKLVTAAPRVLLRRLNGLLCAEQPRALGREVHKCDPVGGLSGAEVPIEFSSPSSTCKLGRQIGVDPYRLAPALGVDRQVVPLARVRSSRVNAKLLQLLLYK